MKWQLFYVPFTKLWKGGNVSVSAFLLFMKCQLNNLSDPVGLTSSFCLAWFIWLASSVVHICISFPPLYLLLPCATVMTGTAVLLVLPALLFYFWIIPLTCLCHLIKKQTRFKHNSRLTCLFSLVTGICSPSSFRSYNIGFPNRSVCDIWKVSDMSSFTLPVYSSNPFRLW